MVLENDINVQEKTTQQHRESINMLEEQNNQLNKQLELESRDVRVLHQVLQKVLTIKSGRKYSDYFMYSLMGKTFVKTFDLFCEIISRET